MSLINSTASIRARCRRQTRLQFARSGRRYIADLLERRQLLATVNGTSGADTITMSFASADITVNLNGTFTVYPARANATMIINGLGGADTIRINSTGPTPTTVNGGDANDTIYVGGGNIDANIDPGNASASQDDVSVLGNAGNDLLVIDDTLDAVGGDFIALWNNNFRKNTPSNTFIRWSTVPAEAIERLDVRLGNSSEEVVILQNLLATTLNAGGGNDTVEFSANVSVAAIASMTVNGGSGTDLFYMEDQTTQNTDPTTITSTTFSQQARTYTYAGFESMLYEDGNLQNTPRAMTVNVESTAIPVTINTGLGNDTFNVGGGDWTGNITAQVNIVPGDGTDRVNVLDASDPNDGAGNAEAYITLSNAITKGSDPSIVFGSAEIITLDSTPFADTYSIPAIGSARSVTINGGSGNDSLSAGTATVGLDAIIAGTLHFNGEGGSDAALFDDSADAGNDSYTVAVASLEKSAAAFGTYSASSTTEQLTLISNNGNNAITVGDCPISMALNINAGGGNDTFTVGGGDLDANHAGSTDLIGGAGSDRVIVDDTLDGPGFDVFDFRATDPGIATSIQKTDGSTASGGFATQLIESMLTINGSPQPTRYRSSGFPIPVVLNAGAGNDTVELGDGLFDYLFTGAITVNAGNGNDSVVIGAGDLDEITERVNVYMHPSIDPLDQFDEIVINDHLDSAVLASAYAIGGTELTRFGGATTFGGLTFDYEDRITFNLSPHDTTINISDFDDFHDVNGGIINGNGGVDLIRIDETVPNHPFTVHGGPGLDTLLVNSNGLEPAEVLLDADEDLQDLKIHAGGSVTLVGSGSQLVTVESALQIDHVLNLNSNSLLARQTSEAYAFERLSRGYNGGGWDGAPVDGPMGVIRSGTAAASVTRDALGYATVGSAAGQLDIATFRGAPVSAGDVVVTYTLAGDTNLDRSVDFADLLAIAQNYDLASRNWVQGDFDFNQATEFADLLAQAQNYGASILARRSKGMGSAIAELRL